MPTHVAPQHTFEMEPAEMGRIVVDFVVAIVLEELDLIVDWATQSLHPRDPDHIVTEIEQRSRCTNAEFDRR